MANPVPTVYFPPAQTAPPPGPTVYPNPLGDPRISMANVIRAYTRINHPLVSKPPVRALWLGNAYWAKPGEHGNYTGNYVVFILTATLPRYAAVWVLTQDETYLFRTSPQPTPYIGLVNGKAPTYFYLGQSASFYQAPASALRAASMYALRRVGKLGDAILKPRRGLGDVASDTIMAFAATVSAGDQYYGAREYDSAIQAYQAGGASLALYAKSAGLPRILSPGKTEKAGTQARAIEKWSER